MDHEFKSPADREAEIRREYAFSKQRIDTLLQNLTFEYQYYNELRETIAEIDFYGAEDYFCPPTKPSTIELTADGEFDF